MNVTEKNVRVATHAEWQALGERVSEFNREAFFAGRMPVTERGVRLLPPGSAIPAAPPAIAAVATPASSPAVPAPKHTEAIDRTAILDEVLRLGADHLDGDAPTERSAQADPLEALRRTPSAAAPSSRGAPRSAPPKGAAILTSRILEELTELGGGAA